MRFIIGVIIGAVLGWAAKGQTKSPDDVQTRTENLRLREQLVAKESEINRLKAELAAASAQPQTPPPPSETKIIIQDDLKEINGIGPAFAKRLNEAGIYRFADLAATSPERLRAIVKPRSFQALDLDDWIAQAKAKSGS